MKIRFVTSAMQCWYCADCEDRLAYVSCVKHFLISNISASRVRNRNTRERKENCCAGKKCKSIYLLNKYIALTISLLLLLFKFICSDFIFSWSFSFLQFMCTQVWVIGFLMLFSIYICKDGNRRTRRLVRDSISIAKRLVPHATSFVKAFLCIRFPRCCRNDNFLVSRILSWCIESYNEKSTQLIQSVHLIVALMAWCKLQFQISSVDNSITFV